MPYQIIRSDITSLPFHVDAIVSPAHPNPAKVGLGVEKQIHEKAGSELQKYRASKGKIDIGHAVVTKAFKLNATYVIHALAPVWDDGKHDEEHLLRQCYDSSLFEAAKYSCKSIAFPLIGSGNLGFSLKSAYRIATDSFRDFCECHELDIYLVVFKEDDFQYCSRQHFNLANNVDECVVQDVLQKEYSNNGEYVPPEKTHERIRLSRGALTKRKDTINRTLESIPNATFSETLLKLISCLGLKDSAVYNKVYITGPHFGKIRSNPNYSTTKPTVIAFAIALELDLAQTTELMKRAGFAFQNNEQFDRLIIDFISQKEYNIDVINAALLDAGLNELCPKERKKKINKI